MKSYKLRSSARGEDCTFNIVGVCNHDNSTTVLCHLPDESGGMGKKPDDISAAFGCSACHNVLDGRTLVSNWGVDKDWYMRRAMIRTWRRWIEMGLVKMAGVK